MNEKFNKNEKVEKFTNMLGIAVRLIVIDPLCNHLCNNHLILQADHTIMYLCISHLKIFTMVSYFPR